MKNRYMLIMLTLLVATVFMLSLLSGIARAGTPGYEKSDEQYNILAGKQDDARSKYEDSKEKFREAKLKYASSKDNQSRDEVENKTKEFLESSINYIVIHLELLKNRVEREENKAIIPFNAASRIDEQIAQLEVIRINIQHAVTDKELTDSARELEDSWARIKLENRYYIGIIVNHGIEMLIEGANNASSRMHVLILKLKEQGVDTSKLEQDASNFDILMNQAKQNHSNDLELYVQHSGFDSNGTILNNQDAKTFINETNNLQKDILKKLKGARDKYNIIMGDIRELQKIQPTVTSVSTVGVPMEYNDFYTKITYWLDTKLVEWKPQSYKPMDFAVYHVFASDNVFVKSNAEVDWKFLDMLEQTNSDIIVLYIRPQNYASQKERYDVIIKKIRTDGKKLFIGARFDDKPMDFAKYDAELTDYTRNIIGSIKPDYYGIVIEPTTMEKKHGFTVSDEEWIKLITKISDLSKQLSPGTKTAVAGHKQELTFLSLASDIQSIDIIGFNIYDTTGIYPEYSGYLGKGDVVGKAIDSANLKGKKTWILETWVTDITASQDKKAMGTQEFMKSVDAKWVRVMAYYAQKHNVNVITPFFTGKFVAYTEEPRAFAASLNNNSRTPVFQSYKDVIKEIKTST